MTADIFLQFLSSSSVDIRKYPEISRNIRKYPNFMALFFQDMFVIYQNPGLENGSSTESVMQSELMEKTSLIRGHVLRNMAINTYLKIRK